MYFGGYGGVPFGYAELWQLDGRQPPTVNAARFRSVEFERTVDRFMLSPNEAGRIAASRAASDIAATYVPLIPAIFRLQNDFVQPWVLGYRGHPYRPYWKYLDIDLARQRQVTR